MSEKSVSFGLKRVMFYFLTAFFLLSFGVLTGLNFLNEQQAFESSRSNFLADLDQEKDKLLYARIVNADEMLREKIEALIARHPSLRICTNMTDQFSCERLGDKAFVDPTQKYFLQAESRVPLLVKALTSVMNLSFLAIFLGTLLVLNRFLQRWLEKNFVRPLVELSNFFSSFTEKRKLHRIGITDVGYSEWQNINQSVSNLVEQLDQLESEVAFRATEDLARQVAHDIRAPLTALNMVVASSSELTDEKRRLIESATTRISDIASDLLGQRTGGATECLRTIVSAVISEKRLSNGGVRIDFVDEMPEQHRAVPRLSQSDLKRILSNVIDNSLDAMAGQCEKMVAVSVQSKGDRAEIKISDTGCGIPPEVLSCLGKKKVSHGKHGRGTGIGLLNAVHKLETNGDSLEVSSTPGHGTVVSIQLGVQ